MRHRLALVAAAAIILAGCHRREITSLERKEAANVVSEAEFAVTLRDWSRAEGLYAKATALCPDQGDTWMNLGIVRMRLHDSGGARKAYKSALAAYESDCEREPVNSVPVIRRAYVLVILGRADEAKSLVARERRDHPDDRRLRTFDESNGLDRMIADPSLKDIAP
jgi:Flp pilus assembly protein TadD